MLTVAWSLYDEFYGLRPWRSYQGEFSKVYSAYLEKQYKQRKTDEQEILLHAPIPKTHGRREGCDGHRADPGPGGRATVDLLDRQRGAMTRRFRIPAAWSARLRISSSKIDEKDKSAKESKLKDLK